MSKAPQYPFEMRPLTAEEGGGWLITFPDLPGCMSDGDTREEAEANVKDAIECWITAARRLGRPVPQPPKAIRRQA
jgi:antitoxin HicB